jgi:secondary thiamine-phosphate synthase enzyme
MAVKSVSGEIEFQTRGNDEIVDITARVSGLISESGLTEGIVNVFIIGSTAAVTTLEYEPGLIADVKKWLREVAPPGDWQHDATWNEANAHSHLRASVIGPSVTVPVNDGRMALGTWQQIAVIDCDVKPRMRKVIVQMIGEVL